MCSEVIQVDFGNFVNFVNERKRAGKNCQILNTEIILLSFALVHAGLGNFVNLQILQTFTNICKGN